VIKKVAERILKPYNRNLEHVEYKSKSDTIKNGSIWNHLKIVQKLPEQQIYRESTESRNFGHCAHT